MKAAWADVTSPPPPPLVPNQRDIFVGKGDFVDGGANILRELIENGLKPNMTVLDIGSGQGRVARPMTEFLSEEGQYAGIDIVKRGVTWCQKHYRDFSNFEFVHANIYNKAYNRLGKTKAADYRFPFADNTFDFIFLTSVFTHMLSADVENYLGEMRRVLKPGGRTFITWFVLNEASLEASLSRKAALEFRYKWNDVSAVVSTKYPEGAIAYHENYILSALAKRRLGLQREIYRGGWAMPEARFFQDYTIADKEA